jgi:hypothetical protein
MKWSSWKLKPSTKSAYELVSGESAFDGSLYLVKPEYIKRRQPTFSLVHRSRHLSGFFKVTDQVFSGDTNGNLLIVLLPNESHFELIVTDIPAGIGYSQLRHGELNDAITQARKRCD